MIPKGRINEENYYVSETTWELIRETVHYLMEHYGVQKASQIPIVSFNGTQDALLKPKPYNVGK